MLTQGDDFPIHQTPEPVALVTDRNFYDRYFFNGMSPDGRIFFAAAMGIYPALDVIDGAFCVCVDGVQHNLRASGRLNGQRMALTVGPISISVDIALWELSLRVAPNEGPLTADLHFTGRHFPIEEPRFTRRNGTRLFMDYTRMTQNGAWSGHVGVNGQRIEIGPDVMGTRDRSWGIRPVGLSDPQPAPGTFGGAAPQFFWLWTPSNFPAHAVYAHTNDDGTGSPWNRRAVVQANGTGRDGARDYDTPDIHYEWNEGTRRVQRVTIMLGPDTKLELTPRPGFGGRGHFYMTGLGYMHPQWGHGMDHGDLEVAHDQIDLATVADNDAGCMHIQALADAVLTMGGETQQGIGVVEQLFLGPHAASGLTGILDPYTSQSGGAAA